MAEPAGLRHGDPALNRAGTAGVVRLVRPIMALLLGALLAPGLTGAAEPPAGSALLSHLRQPPPAFRLKARTVPTVAALAALAAAGFGGAEVGVDFGAPPAQARGELTALLAAARAAHLELDLAPGGSQPYVSPAISMADSMQELVADMHLLDAGEVFQGAIRQPAGLAGQATLVAVTAARIARRTGAQLVLDADSAIDLTARLTAGQTLHWAAHPGQWVLFSFWQRATGQVMGGNPFEAPAGWSARVPTLPPGRYFTADIFSAAGIGSALDYLAKDILPANPELLVGGDLAHDSLEVQAEVFWTGDLPREFRRRRGYSLLPFLPAIVAPRKYSFNPLDPRWGGPLPPAPYEFTGDVGERVRYDFDRTLTDLYVERYLGTLDAWAHARGMQSRVQVAYNYFSLDMLRSGRAVDIPENESFDSGWSRPFDPTLPAYGSERWRHMIDSYRLTGSSKDLAGRTRATLEFGDDFAIYRKEPIDYARQLDEALAGGITMGLLTAYTGTDTAWPTPRGLAAIGLGDAWTSGWPQWRDWPALADYFARSTVATEFGQPVIDVAIYHDRGLASVHDDAPLFASGSLAAAGYTYEFVDPAALVSPAGTRGAHSLFERVGYRAIILDHQRAVPVAAARALLRLARRGVVIVIIGAAPSASPGWWQYTTADRAVRSAMRTLMAQPSVLAVAGPDQAAAALARLGCQPSVSLTAGATLLTVHRRAAGIDLWWLYNPSDTLTRSVGSFHTEGVPSQVDLWSGRTSAVPVWQRAGDATQLPIVLAAHHSTVVIFQQAAAVPLHVTRAGDARLLAGPDGALVVTGPHSVARLTLSDGRMRDVDLSGLPAPIRLSSWRLHVDEFAPAGRRAHDLMLQSLQDWRHIPELRDAVGQARYVVDITLGDAWFGPDRTAVLSIGQVAGAMRLSINGQLVTEQSTGEGTWLVGPLLRRGVNRIEMRLDTTLANRMAALRASGARPYQTGPTLLQSAPSGVLGPVVLSSGARLALVGK